MRLLLHVLIQYVSSTASKELSAIPIIVGKIIISDKILAERILFPVIGTMITIPKKPYATEGIPASNSMPGLIVLRNSFTIP